MLPHPPGSRGGRVVAVSLITMGMTCSLIYKGMSYASQNNADTRRQLPALPGTIVLIASSRGGGARLCAPTTFATNVCARSQFNVIEV